MKTVLVTGCAGFIGMHTCLRLLQEGHRVIGIDVESAGVPIVSQLHQDRLTTLIVESDNFTYLKCDLRNMPSRQMREQYLGDVTHLIHLAAKAGVRDSIKYPEMYTDNNVTGFVHLLETALKLPKLERVVYASSSSVHGDGDNNPKSMYALTKKMNEDTASLYSRVHGLKSVGLRFFTVYGPWGRPDMAPMLFADALSRHEKVEIFNRGQMGRDFTYISDVVEAIMRSLDVPLNDTLVLDIGKGSTDPLLSFLGRICLHFPESKSEMVYVDGIQKGDVEKTKADFYGQLALKWTPQVGITEGCKLFCDWYKQYHDLKT